MDPRSGPPQDPRSPQRPPQDEPPAPEPAWPPEAGRYERQFNPDDDDNFNRERFILRCVAWIIGVQFGLFIVAGVLCSYMAVKLLEGNHIFRENAPKICPTTEDNIRRSAAESLAVLLALLGGSSIARGEQQRRDERRGQLDPRSGGRLPPSR